MKLNTSKTPKQQLIKAMKAGSGSGFMKIRPVEMIKHFYVSKK
jgi:hypothetical protein